MPEDVPHRLGEPDGRRRLASLRREHGGNEVAPEHLPCAVEILRGVDGIGERHALAPSIDLAPVGLGAKAHEQREALGLGAEGGRERRHERHPQGEELDGADPHERSRSST